MKPLALSSADCVDCFLRTYLGVANLDDFLIFDMALLPKSHYLSYS